MHMYTTFALQVGGDKPSVMWLNTSKGCLSGCVMLLYCLPQSHLLFVAPSLPVHKEIGLSILIWDGGLSYLPHTVTNADTYHASVWYDTVFFNHESCRVFFCSLSFLSRYVLLPCKHCFRVQTLRQLNFLALTCATCCVMLYQFF
jgi:hypothetical protein